MEDRIEQAKAFLDDRWLLATPVKRKSNRPECPSHCQDFYFDDFVYGDSGWRLLVFTTYNGRWDNDSLPLVDEVWSCRAGVLGADDRWARLPLRSMPESFGEAVQEAVDMAWRYGSE